MKTYAFLSLLVALPLAVACSASSDDNPADDAELEEAPGALTSSDVDCSKTTMTAYQGGSRIADVEVIKVGGKNITMKTAHAFLYLQKKAAEKGSNIWINSGFRTMDEQTHLYHCYQTHSCNNGNLAARPGFSNHQNGRAVDIGTDNRGALDRVIRDLHLEWRRTVPSEDWHYEYFGALIDGPCSAGATPPPANNNNNNNNTPDDGHDDTPEATDGGAAPATCSNDGDCNPGSDGAGMICDSSKKCVPGCHSNAQCPGNTTCKQGECK